MQDIVKTRGAQVYSVLSGLDTRTGILVISEALNMLVERAVNEVFGSVRLPPVRRRLKSPRHISHIERDKDILDFIHAQEETLNGIELLAQINEKFGKERAPSKSALYRYLASITDDEGPGEAEN